MEKRKSLFEYDNYREFLRDFYLAAKAHDKKFSFRYFSRIAGFASSSVLKSVMEGKRNIATHSIDKFAKALKLNKEETLFFKNLVLLNQSTNSEEKTIFAEQILKSRLYKKAHPLSGAQFNYFKHWYFIPVRELVNLRGFKEDARWIAKKINPPITPAEAQKALDELIKLGLLVRDENQKLIQSSSNVSSGDEVVNSVLATFHREMLQKASESIDRFPREKRDISAVILGLSEETMKEIKEMVQKFRKELMEVASRTQAPNLIYQLNFQLFPLSDKSDEDIS